MSELDVQPRRTWRGTWAQIVAHQDEIASTSEVEVRVLEPEPATDADPTIALLESWIAQAPTDREALGILTNPRRPPETVSALQWALTIWRAGHRFIVPAIADYEVRRELQRAAKTAGLAALDAWNNAAPDRYLPLTDSALRLGATLWARARYAGTATADPKELDADVLIAAQAIDLGLPPTEFIVATVNVGHLALFVPADRWANITP